MRTPEQVEEETRSILSGDHGEEEREAMLLSLMELRSRQMLDLTRCYGSNGVHVMHVPEEIMIFA